MAKILPGSVSSILNYDLTRPAVVSNFITGIDPSYLSSYVAHYVTRNPWLEFWGNLPSGKVAITERDSPSSAFVDSEFYNDWLAPQRHMGAATGIKIDLAVRKTILVGWNYDVESAYGYDAQAAAILHGVRSSFKEAAQAAHILGGRLERKIRLGQLIRHIDGAAILVTRNRCIREANDRAATAFDEGNVVGNIGGRLTIRGAGYQARLDEMIQRVLDRGETEQTDTFIIGEHVVGAVVTAAPTLEAGENSLLVPPAPLALVVLKRLAGGSVGLDDTSLRAAYGLSAGECRLCGLLLNGYSIAEAAELLGVTEGTVRQRVKMIFQKTGTHRQGELVARLAGFTTAVGGLGCEHNAPIWE